MNKNELINMEKHAKSIENIRKNIWSLDECIKRLNSNTNTETLEELWAIIDETYLELSKYQDLINFLGYRKESNGETSQHLYSFTEEYIANAERLIRKHIGGVASGELLILFYKLKDDLDSLKSGALPNGVARIKILSCVDTIAKIKSVLANNHLDNDAFPQIFDYCNGIEMNLKKLRDKAFGK